MKEGETLSTFLSLYNQCSIIYYTKYLISVRAHHFQIGVSTNSKPHSIFDWSNLLCLTHSTEQKIWWIHKSSRNLYYHYEAYCRKFNGWVEMTAHSSRNPSRAPDSQQNNAECFQCTCFAVLAKTTGREPLFPDEHAYSFLRVSYNLQ